MIRSHASPLQRARHVIWLALTPSFLTLCVSSMRRTIQEKKKNWDRYCIWVETSRSVQQSKSSSVYHRQGPAGEQCTVAKMIMMIQKKKNLSTLSLDPHSERWVPWWGKQDHNLSWDSSTSCESLAAWRQRDAQQAGSFWVTPWPDSGKNTPNPPYLEQETHHTYHHHHTHIHIQRERETERERARWRH